MTRALSSVSRRLLLGGATAAAVACRARAATGRGAGGNRAFAWLEGRWRVRHLRRVGPGEGGRAWIEATGACVVAPLLDGHGVIEDHSLQTRAGGFNRACLRLFDPVDGAWSAWGLGRGGVGVGPRLAGRVEGTGVVFYGAEMRGGRAVNVRQAWSDVSARGARWSQAVSHDAATGWTTDYVIDFARPA